MRIFFAGTPEIAVKTLEAAAEKHEICGVLTNPDRPAGRKGVIKPPPVKEAAARLGLDVLQPEKPDEEFIKKVKSLKPELLLTFAYGRIFRENFLSIFPVEALNIHPSLLPKYRGPSPLGAAILAGERETGITIQRMALKMDTGDIIRQVKFSLTGKETLADLTFRAADISAELAKDVLADIESGNYTACSQDESAATYCSLVKKEDGLIDWKSPSVAIERKYRAYYPWPGIYTYWKGKMLLITCCGLYNGGAASQRDDTFEPGTVAGVDRKEGILIKTGDSYIAVRSLKPEGKKEMDFISFINGARDFPGSRLDGFGAGQG